MIRKLGAGILLTMLASSAAMAQVGAPKVAITIYNNNLALVEETRTLDLAGGRQRIEFRDVSAQIRAETVSLSAPGMAVVEQNFDYDLLSPAKMMEKAVGREVQIVRINPGNGAEVRETATVLSVNDGVVLKIGDRIEILRDDGVPTRVIFDKVPENLRARPTLSVTVNAAAAGGREAKLSYLTTGLGWKADYVALFDEKAGKLDLTGWITLTNNSGTTFSDADTTLIAGQVNLSNGYNTYQPPRPRPRQANGSTTRGGTEGGDTGADFKVYPLEQRTTIAQNQNKQVGLLNASGVAAAKIYQFHTYDTETDDNPHHAIVAIDFANSAKSGLGSALPAGTMQVYIRDQTGDPKFAGENAVDHTPQGSQLTVKIGEAFDITVQATEKKVERVSDRAERIALTYVIRNARAEPVNVQLIQDGLARAFAVEKQSLKGVKLDSTSQRWDVPVPANGSTTLSFTVLNRWP